MQKVEVINATGSDTAVLGLGKVAAGATKTGYIPQVVFDPDQPGYMACAALVGIGMRDLSNAVPFVQTGRQDITGAATIADATRLALLTAASVDYAAALPAAADVPAGDVVHLYFQSGAYTVALTPDGTDTQDGLVGYDLAATPADNTGTGFVITTTHTITRNDGGDWLAEGYVQGGRIVIQGAEDAGNNGTHVIATVAASVITVTSTLTNNANDTTAHFGVDNRVRMTLSDNLVRLQSDGVSNWTTL